MRAVDEGTVHPDGVVSGKAGFHAEVVIVLTVHHGGVNHAGPVGCGDPVRRQNGPCGCRLAARHGPWEERFVRPSDEG